MSEFWLYSDETARAMDITAAFLAELSEIPDRAQEQEQDQAPAGCCASCHRPPLAQGQKLCVYCLELRALTGSVPFPLPVPGLMTVRRRDRLGRLREVTYATGEDADRIRQLRRNQALVLAAVLTVCALVALIASYPVTWPMAFPGALLFLMAAHAGAGRRS